MNHKKFLAGKKFKLIKYGGGGYKAPKITKEALRDALTVNVETKAISREL